MSSWIRNVIKKKEYNLQNRSVIIYIDFFYEDYTWANVNLGRSSLKSVPVIFILIRPS